MTRNPAIALFLLFAMPAAAKPKLPPCPPPAPQLFFSPMGEPFRAAPGGPDPVAAWFGGADADRDGRITRKELTADADRFFATLDADHDGELIPDEVTHYERAIAPEIQLFRPRGFGAAVEKAEIRAARRPIDRDAPAGAGRWSFLNIPQPVSSADEDFNRGVTRDEFRAAAAARFVRIDKAGQGALTLATLPMTPARAATVHCVAPVATKRP